MTHIDGGYFDHDRYPIPPKRVERSKTECVHTPMPEGYIARFEWAHQALKTHRQVRCPVCRLWAIWLPKAEAREINKADEREARALSCAYANRLRSEDV